MVAWAFGSRHIIRGYIMSAGKLKKRMSSIVARDRVLLSREYIIYDERAMLDVDEASVLGVCDSLGEAKRDVKDLGYNAAVYSYKREGGKLVDQQYEWSSLNEGV